MKPEPCSRARLRQRIALQRAIRSRKAAWLLRVTNKASKKACVLHFRSIDRADDDPVTSRQADLKLFNYKPTWKLAARHDWFVRLQRDFFDKWFEMCAATNSGVASTGCSISMLPARP